MSQPQQETEKIKPPPRRSSLLQHAIKEGIPIPGNEFLRGLSSAIKQNVVRNSAGQQMSQNYGQQNSLNPTPLSSIPGHRGEHSAKGTSIPCASNSSLKKKFMQPTSSSVAKSKPVSTARNTYTLNATSALPQRSVGNHKNAHPNVQRGPPTGIPEMRSAVKGKDRYGMSRNTNLRKSTSMDSVWHSNTANNTMLMTPSVTPGHGISMRCKSPGSLRRWGSAQDIQRDNLPQAKSITVSRDNKKVLMAMLNYVHNFLFERRYPNLPALPNDLKKISTSTYYNMVYFVGKFIVGHAFFPAKEDQVTRIVELSLFLKYPGPMSKSHLKSANAQHAWPSSVTFLCWLCCRVDAISSSETQKSPMNDLMQDTFPEVTLQHYLNIFYYCKYPSLGNLSDQERQTAVGIKSAEELNAFKSKVSEMFMSEVNFTIEELNAQKDEKLEHLKDVLSKPDPVKELSGILDDKRKILQAMKKKIFETQEQTKIYRDINSIRSKAEGLQREIISRQSEIEAANEIISSQPFDKRGEKKLLMEIHNIKEQRKCLGPILIKLEKDLLRNQQLMANLHDRFRTTIAQFTVVETFNANLSNLRVDGLLVPVNPLTPEELKDWLEEVERIHDKTEQVSQRLMEAVNGELVKLEGLKLSTKDQINVYLQENERKEEIIKNLSARNEETYVKFETEKKCLEAKCTDLNEQLNRCKEFAEAVQKTKDTDEATLNCGLVVLERNTKVLEKWWTYVENLADEMNLREAISTELVTNKTVEAMKELQEIIEMKKDSKGSLGTGGPQPGPSTSGT